MIETSDQNMKKKFETEIIKIAENLKKLGTNGSIFLHGFTKEEFDSLSDKWKIEYNKPEDGFRKPYLNAKFIINDLDINLFTRDL